MRACASSSLQFKLFGKSTVTQKWLFVGTAFLGLFLSGCSMADTVTATSPVSEHVKAVEASAAAANAKALDAEVTKFLRKKYAIKSATYYSFGAGIPWVAISKNVQNQMREKSVERVIYDWNNPGIDFVDVYPQGDTAFAVAMYTKTSGSKEKFVGYYVLTTEK
jgi:hypothetical protein